MLSPFIFFGCEQAEVTDGFFLQYFDLKNGDDVVRIWRGSFGRNQCHCLSFFSHQLWCIKHQLCVCACVQIWCMTTESCLQWESRQAEFPSMDSCGDAFLRAANKAHRSLTVMSAVCIKAYDWKRAVKQGWGLTDVCMKWKCQKCLFILKPATAGCSWIRQTLVLKFNLFGFIPLR